MRPIYTPPSFDKKPSPQTASKQSASKEAHLKAKTEAAVKEQASSTKNALASSPALAGKPQALAKSLVFRTVTSQELLNLMNDDSGVEAAIQDGSIFEMQFQRGNALNVACHLEKFDLATRLLEHPLAGEAFLKDKARMAHLLHALFYKTTRKPEEAYAFLKTFIQQVNLQSLDTYIKQEMAFEFNGNLFSNLISRFFRYKDTQGLKDFLGKLDGENKLHVLKLVRNDCIQAITTQKENFLSFFQELIAEGIVVTDKDFYTHLIDTSGKDAASRLGMLDFIKRERLITSQDGIEAPILSNIAHDSFDSDRLDNLIGVLQYSISKHINVFDKKEDLLRVGLLTLLRKLPGDLGRSESSEMIEPLKEKIKSIFDYIQSFGHKAIFDNDFIQSFLDACTGASNKHQEHYFNDILDQITALLGKEKFLQYIENPSILGKFLINHINTKDVSVLSIIKSLIERGANPMVEIDPETSPYPLLNLKIFLDVQRCLAQSQHRDYKAFVLATIFGLKSARLPGGNCTSSAPIIEKGFEAFLKAFPSKLDSPVIGRIQKAYTQSMSFDNRKDLLKHFEESPADPDTIQIAYLNADGHVYAYVMYQDMLIETQRSEEPHMLVNGNQLFYMTNATTVDGEKVRAIQMLPIDKAEAQNLLKESATIEDYHLRFGEDTISFCQKYGTLIEDLGPLLEHLGLETSFSTLTDPLQQKKVALGEIFQILGYLEKDGSGAILDALKDKDSAELAYALKKSTNLDAETFISWLEDPSLSKVDFLKKVLDTLGITKKKLYYVSDADRKDPLAAIAFEKTPQKTGNCYFASPMLNFGALMWWATVLERAKEQGITVTCEHVGQNPEFYKAIYKEVEPTYKELVRFMKLNSREDYQQRFGKLSNPEMQAEIEAKVAKFKSPSYLADSEEDV